jgi:enoyl-CoA hydratase
MNEVVQYQNEEKYALITLQNGKVNAISHEVIDGLNAALNNAEQERKIVILTGQPGIFSAGFDLKTMTKGADSAKELVTKGSELSLRMLSFPMPIIIACSGHAIAKGAFMLLYADYRIGVAGNFKIGLNEVMIGMTMHHAGIEVARARLAPIFFERSVNNSEIYTPKGAVAAGFLDVIVSEKELLPTAIQTALLFTKLNAKAHAATKLRLRTPYINKIRAAIDLDLKSEIAINS